MQAKPQRSSARLSPRRIKVIPASLAAHGRRHGRRRRPALCTIKNFFRLRVPTRMSIVEKELALLASSASRAACDECLAGLAVECRRLANSLGERRRRGDFRRRQHSRGRCTQLRLDVGDAAAAQIARLAATLPSTGQESAGAAARFWRSFRPRAHLRLLAHRARRRQGRRADRCGRTGGTGSRPWLNACAVCSATATEPLAAFAPDGTLVYANAAAQARLSRRDHAVGARHRDARRNSPGNRQRQRHRAHRPSGFRRHGHTPRQRRHARACCSPCRRSQRDSPDRAELRRKACTATRNRRGTPTPAPLAPSPAADRRQPRWPRSDAAALPDDRGAAASVALRLAHGCRRPLRRRVPTNSSSSPDRIPAPHSAGPGAKSPPS